MRPDRLSLKVPRGHMVGMSPELYDLLQENGRLELFGEAHIPGRGIVSDTGNVPRDTDTEHRYELGDRFERPACEVWRVSNRMVDVDTDELLYRLHLIEPDGPRHGDSQIRSEGQLRRSSSGWSCVDPEGSDDGE